MTISQYSFDDDMLQQFSDEVRFALQNGEPLTDTRSTMTGHYIINDETNYVFTRIYSFTFNGDSIPIGFSLKDCNVYSIYGTGKLNNEVFVIPSIDTNIILKDDMMTLTLPGKDNAEIFIKITYGV